MQVAFQRSSTAPCVRAHRQHNAGRPTVRVAAQKKQLMMWEALREAVDEEMEKDPTVCVMGEQQQKVTAWAGTTHELALPQPVHSTKPSTLLNATPLSCRNYSTPWGLPTQSGSSGTARQLMLLPVAR